MKSVWLWIATLALCTGIAYPVYNRAGTQVQGSNEYATPPGGWPLDVTWDGVNTRRLLVSAVTGALVTQSVAGGPATQVEGTVADGAPAGTQNPVTVSGVDGSGNVQRILVDTNGNQVVEGLNAGTAITSTQPIAVGYSNAADLLDWPRLAIPNADNTSVALNHVLCISNGYSFNSVGWDRNKTANAASGTSGVGIPASGTMYWDGVAWQKWDRSVTVAGSGTTQVEGTVSDGTAAGTQKPVTTSGVDNGGLVQRILVDTTGTQKTSPHAQTFKNTPTVQAAAYASGDLVGGKQSFADFTRVAGGANTIQSIVISSNAGMTSGNLRFNVVWFDSDPTATTFTENSPLTVADTDLDRVIGVLSVDSTNGTFINFVDNSVVNRDSLALKLQLAAANSTLYFCLIAAGAPTFAAADDLQVTFVTEPN